MTQTRPPAARDVAPKPASDPAEYRKLVQQVADKVWALWREELRRERERRGSEISKCHP
jgi:hypothetical protein